MNFAGKFDAELPVEGPSARPSGHFHVDSASAHAPSDAIIVPDAHLLFGGDFKRSGVDLILSNDERELVLHDYFKGEKRVALASPDGAHLTGDIVNALTGYVDYAQADGSQVAAVVVGHVTKLSGSATAIRNGVSIILNQGDNIDKGDVLQSGSDSTLGVTFIDGTVFGLSSNARMVVNEMVYDPNGSNNSSLLSLVAGTISFVAGETAKHGDMKVDTPVATMGIRGTAVLVEIDFAIPGQGGAPAANFQVLVEPDGTTGSYILFDKTTLAPLATVNTAGTQTSISQGVVSFLNTAPLTPDAQKLITDVFAQKFTDNTNINTKTTTAFTDTIIPQSGAPIKVTVTETFIQVPSTSNATGHSASSNSNGPADTVQHIDGAPSAVVVDASGHPVTAFSITELAGKTGDITDLDIVSGKVNFVDVNAGDLPTVKTSFSAFSYQNANGNNVTAALNAQQLADIKAVEVHLAVVQDPGNTNNGSATFTYSVPDGAFDFLAAGETLTLTYIAEIDNNYAPNNEATFKPFTITITGTNDVPVITSSVPQTIAFAGGTSTPGGDLIAHVPTTGTLSFTDADLTDTHTVSTALTGVALNGGTLAPGPLGIFETALTASIATDSTGTGSGTVTWTLADLPVYLADFIPKGETLTLTYTVTVQDSQNATTTQNVIVTITGTDTPAVVWIHTTTPGSPSGGLWSDPSNWETGTVPTANDDAIIITNQLIGLTPSYPVTINAPAVAKSVTMNDFGTSPPQLINESTLTIAGAFDLGADSIVKNDGTISVGGPMEVLDTSTLQNSGIMTLAAGGDFSGQSTISNSSTGSIEVSGGTLNVLVDVANAGLLTVDSGATLTLNGATIAGGTVIDNGTIHVTGTSAIDGAMMTDGQVSVDAGKTLTLDGTTVTGGTITNTGATVTVDSGQALTLQGGVALVGGTLSNSGTVNVEGSSGATLDGVTITGAGAIQIDLATSAAVTLVLDDGTAVTGGTLTMGPVGTLVVETAGGATLHDVGVTNGHSIEVFAGSTLTLDQLTTVTNTDGTIKVDATGALTLNSATMTGGTVTDNGTLNLNGAGVLDNGSLGNAGQINVSGSGNALDSEIVTANNALEVMSAGTLTLDQGTTVANAGGTIKVDATGALTLNFATITGGTVTDSGTLSLNGTAALKNGLLGNAGQITVSGSGNALDNETVTANTALEVMGNSALTLDQGTTFANAGGAIKVDSTGVLTLTGAAMTGETVTDNGTLNLNGTAALKNGSLGNAGQINVGGSGNALDNETITANNALEVVGNGALTLDQGTTFANAGGAIKVDSTGILTLTGAAITGGTVTDNGTLNLNGTAALKNGSFGNFSQINVSGSGNGLDNETVTTNNALELLAGSTLTLDQGTTFANAGGIVKVAATGALTLNSAAITGGTVTNNGTLSLNGTGVLDNGSFDNSGQINVSGSGNALDNETVTSNNALEVLTAGALTFDQGTTFANAGGTIKVDSTATLALTSATITGGTITDNGTLSLNGTAALKNGSLGNAGQINISGSGNALDNETVTANNALEVVAGAALTLDQGTTFANAGGTIKVDSTGTLTLNGATITGGTVIDNGTIHVTGTSAIDGAMMTDGQVTIDAGKTLTLDGTTVTGGTITNTGATVTVDSGQTLTLQGGVALVGGTLSNSGTVNVEGSSGATLDGVTVTGSGAIQVDVAVSPAVTLVLDDGTAVTGGTLTMGPVGTLAVETAGGATLHDVGVTNGHSIEVFAGSTLTLDQGTTVANAGGTIKVDSTGALTLTGAIITGGTVTDNGILNLNGTAALKNGSLGNSGQINVSGSGNALDSETVTANSALEVLAGAALTLDQGTTFANANGTIKVDSTGALTLNGATITGGTVTDNGILNLNGTAALQNGSLGNAGQINISGGDNALNNETVTANNALEVLTGGALTLDQGTTVANAGGTVKVDATGAITLNSATITDGTVTDNGTLNLNGTAALKNGLLGNAGQINVSGSGNALDNETVTANSALEVMAGGALTLDQGATFANAGGIVTIDPTGALTLNGATITGGTVTDNGILNLNGTGVLKNGSLGNSDQINVSGSGNALDNETVTANSALEVVAGAALTLDQGTTIANAGGTVKVDSTGTLTLNSATITGGTVTDNGTLNLNGAAALKNGSLGNAGQIKVSGTGNALDSETVTANNALEVMAGAVLTLDQGTTFANANGTIKIDSTGGLTLNSATITGGTVTDNGTLNLNGTAALKNGLLGNAGQINVSGSGNALDNETVTVNSALEVLAGAALTLDQGATFANAGGTIKVDSTGALTLSSATITGGTVTDNGTLNLNGTAALKNGSLGNAGQINISGSGNALDNETVTANNALEVLAGAELTLDQGATFANAGGTIKVDSTSTLTLNGATIAGGTVTDNGTIHVTGTSAIDGAMMTDGQVTIDAGKTLTLDGTTVTGGTITNTSATVTVDSGQTLTLQGGVALVGGTLSNSGTVNVESSSGATLDGVTFTGSGAIQVDLATSAAVTLVLDDGTAVTGGTLTMGPVGTLAVETAGGATLHDVGVTNGHSIDVFAGSTLTLDQGTTVANAGGTVKVDATGAITLNSATITGGTVTDNGILNLNGTGVLKNGSLGNAGQINVSGSGNALDNETVTANSALEVLAGAALTLDQGATFANAGGTIKVDSTGALTLSSATITGGTVTDNGTLNLNGTAALKIGSLANAGQINVSGSGNALDNETVTANSALEVLAGAALTLDQGTTVANAGGTIKVDSTGALTLNSATMTGGTVTDNGTLNLNGAGVLDNGSLGNAGQINVSGSGNALDNETVTANSALEVLTGGALTFDQGTTFANASGTVKVDSTATLALSSATITGGTITDNGTLSLNGTGVLQNGSLGNAGQINISGGDNALDNETVTANNALEVLTGGALTLDQGTTFANAGGIVTIDPTGALTLNGATITGGTVTDNGILNLNGTGVLKNGSLGNSDQINVSGSGNALDNETVTANSALEVVAGAALTLDQGTTIANAGGTVKVDSTGTLTLNFATITGGTVTDNGTLNLNGTAALKNGSLANAGQINVSGSGNALDNETVTANSALEVLAGAALTLDQGTTVANAGGTIKVDSTGALTLNSATMTGGTVTDNGTLNLNGAGVLDNGSLGNAGQINVSGSGNALDSEIVTANNALEVMSAGTLTLDQGTTVANAGGTIKVDATGALTLNFATITGGTVTDSGTLSLNGTAALKNGLLGNAGQITVSGSGNALDNETVTANTALEVMGNSALTLDQGTTFANAGGAIKVDSTGVLTLTGAAMTGETVTDNGTLNLNGTAALKNGSLGNAGQINVGGSGNALDNETITANNALEVVGNGALTLDQGTTFANAGGAIKVDSTGILTLTGAAITGGTVTDNGTLNLNGTAALKNGSFGNFSQINVSGSGNGLDNETVTTNNALELLAGSTLTLDQGTTFANAGGIVKVAATGALTLNSAAITSGTVTNNGTVSLNGTGVLQNGSLGNAGQINISGSGNALDNETVTANNTLEVLAGAALTLDQGATFANAGGTIKVDSTGTLTLNGATITGGTVTDNGTIHVTGTSAIDGAMMTDGQVTIDVGKTLTLDGTTVTGGTITNTSATVTVDSGQTLTLQGGVALVGGTLSNSGTVNVEGSSGATLNSVTINGGALGNSGTLDSTGTSGLTDVDVTNSGTLESTAGTLTIDASSSVDNSGTLAANGGILIIDANITGNGSATISGGGTLEIGAGAIDAQAVNFDGAGTLQLDDLTSYTGTVTGLAENDVIGFANTTVITAVWNGSVLTVNGTPTAFTVADLPAGDTFGFKNDHDAAELAVLKQVETVGSSSAFGVEVAPITLHFTDALTAAGSAEGATLTSFVIADIPAGAIVADAQGNVLAVSNGTVTLDSLQLANGILTGLTITPANDTNFTLSALATATDSAGYQYTVPTSEQVTVNPTAPTLTWAASVSGTETQIALGNLVETITGQSGDSNSADTFTISGAPAGVTLSDGHGHSAISDGSTAIDVSGWTLSGLSADTSSAAVQDGNFTLTATATEVDAEGNVSASTSVNETVTVSPTAPTLTWAASVSGTETQIALGNLAETITGQSGDHNNADMLTISGAPAGVTLSDGHGHSAISDGSTAIDVSGWTLSGLSADTSSAAVPTGNFTLTATATEVDAEGNVSASTSATEVVTVTPEAPTVTPVAETGVEFTAIPLDLGTTLNGLTGDSNSLASLVVDTIPVGATLSDGQGNTFTATTDHASVDVHGWNLLSLTITPTDAANFMLGVTATAQDAEGNLSAPIVASEAITVTPEAPTVAPVAETGVEGTAIALDLGTTVNGLTGDSNSLASLVVDTIPVGATLSDGQGNTFTATADHASVDVHSWNLLSLTITPTDAANFMLGVTATAQDAEGNLSAPIVASEAITVTPEAPTVAPVAETGVEFTAIALDLGTTVNSLTGDSNSLASLVVDTIPVGATLTDGSIANTFTATTDHTSVDVHGWNLSSLTITPTDAANFMLGVTATAQDADGNLSAPIVASEAITVTPEAPTVAPVAETGVEFTAIALDLGTTVNGLTGDSNSLASLVVDTIPVGATLSDGQGNTFTATTDHTSVDVHSWNLSSLTVTPTDAANFMLGVTATAQDTEGNLSAPVIASETVTVTPEAPTVTPVAETGVEFTAIPLDLGTTVNSLGGETNTLASLVVDTIPVGATLSDGQGNTFTATADHASVDVHSWNLLSLTITPTDAANFMLGVTATAQDAEGNASASTSATEVVTVTPEAPTVTPVAETGVEFTAIPLDLGTTVNSLGGETNTLASLVVDTIPVGATLSDGQGNTFTATADHTSVDIHSWNLLSLTITPTDAANFMLGVTATAQDAEGNLSAPVVASEAITVTPASSPTANDLTFDVLGTSASLASTIIFDDSAPWNDPFTVTGVSNGVTTATTDSIGAFEIAGSHGELYVFPHAVSGVTVGAFTDKDFQAGDLVLVPNPDPGDPIHSLAPGATLTDVFTYTITDSVTHLSSNATATFIYADSDIYTGQSGGSWTDDTNWMFNAPGTLSNIAYIGANTQVDASGATIDGIAVDTFDASSALTVASGAIVTLEDDTGISGGTLTIGGGAELLVAYGTSDAGATLDGVAVGNGGTVQVGASVYEDPTLTLEDGTSINGGTISIASGSTLQIEYGTHGPGATLDGVSVDNSGNVQVDGEQNPHTAILTLDDDSGISGGLLTIGSLGELDIASGPSGAGATLDGVTIDNSGVVHIEDGATLSLADTVTLQDGGAVVLLSSGDPTVIAGPSPDSGTAELDNVDNNISGSGTIGDGRGTLTLDNETGGTIDANVSGGGALTLNTGSTIINDGLLEATNGGNLVIDDSVNNANLVVADGGMVTVGTGGAIGGTGTFEIKDSGVAEIVNSSEQNVSFAGIGMLLLDDSQNYRNGVVSGFAAGDTIDLADLKYSATETDVWNSANGTLTISNGDAQAIIHLAGSYNQADFALTQDSGTGTDITLPAAGVAAAISTGNIALAAQASFGGSGEHQGTALAYADGHLYLSYNIGAEQQNTSDNADIVALNTAPNGATQAFSYAWSAGDLFGIAANSGQIYAAGESYPGDGLTTDTNGGIEAKSIFVSFDADGIAGSDPAPADSYTAHTFYPYNGVEGFQGVIATTQGVNTILYAFGFGQPNSYSGYIIGEYSSSGALLASAEDQGGVPGGSSANAAVDWSGAIWAVGTSEHGSEAYNSPTVWTFSYDLGSVAIYEDNIGVAGSFSGVATIGSELYAVGDANVAGGQSYLVAGYNPDGSVAWSDTFGAAGASSSLSGAVAIDGRLFVVGSTTSSGTTEGVLMEINPSNGNVLSTTTYDPAQYNSFTSVTSDGHYLYVGGVSGAGSSSDQAVLLTYYIGGTTTTTVEDTSVTLHSLAVSDTAAGTEQIEVTLAAGHGTLALVNGSGLEQIVGAETGSVELFGSQSAINAALTSGVVYDPASNYTGPDTLTVTASDEGHNATGSAVSTTQTVGIDVTPADTIADGATHNITGPSGETVVFAGGTGSLVLESPSTFTGQISGFTGTAPDAAHSDMIDLMGIDHGAGSFTQSFDAATDTLSVSDGIHAATLHFSGTYQEANFSFASDGNGGTIVYDPPVVTGADSNAGLKAQAVSATGQGFVFNFANGGESTSGGNHPDYDAHPFDHPMLATAAPTSTNPPDPAHGNSTLTPDGHDAFGWSAAIKAQSHAHDFHIG